VEARRRRRRQEAECLLLPRPLRSGRRNAWVERVVRLSVAGLCLVREAGLP